jgi:RimJ/RimL family protein N-acetyltransferase
MRPGRVTEIEEAMNIQDQRGLGLAVEAVQGILDAVWSSGVSRVVAVIFPENVASQRVAESAGFSYERDVPYKEFGTVRLYAATPH